MLLVSFPAGLSADLDLIQQLPSEQLFTDFLTLAIDAINGKALPPKVVSKAATQLGVESVAVEKCIKGLGLLLINCAKMNASVAQFSHAIAEFSFNDDQLKQLTEEYQQYHIAIRSTLHQQSQTGQHLESFEWRLDVEIASRSCRNTFKPTYVCALTTKNQNETAATTQTEILQCDYAMMNFIHDQLAVAINESKTPHARRIQKYVG